MNEQTFIRLALYHWANDDNLSLYQAYGLAKELAGLCGFTNMPDFPMVQVSATAYKQTMEAAA